MVQVPPGFAFQIKNGEKQFKQKQKATQNPNQVDLSSILFRDKYKVLETKI